MKFTMNMASTSLHFTNRKVNMTDDWMIWFAATIENEGARKKLSQYKKNVAELTLENVVIKGVIAKKL